MITNLNVSKKLKEIVCGLWGGHRYTEWLWAEEVDYACRQCKHCKVLQWGGTLEYIRTFPNALDKPQVIKRTL